MLISKKHLKTLKSFKPEDLRNMHEQANTSLEILKTSGNIDFKVNRTMMCH